MMDIFTWDLYSMYVVLQGIGSLSCKRVYIIYVIPFGSSNPGCLKFLNYNVSTKKQVPRNDKFLFILYEKNDFFRLTAGYPPTTGVVELWKKSILQWKPMELGGDPQKNDEYVHWGRIFYVCSSARNWVSSMYKGIYHLWIFLWGVATLYVWTS